MDGHTERERARERVTWRDEGERQIEADSDRERGRERQ